MLGILAALIPEIMKIAGKFFDTAEKKAEFEQTLQMALVNKDSETFKTMASVITSEIQGESWLQRNWRPLLMMVCIVIITNNLLLVPYFQALFNCTNHARYARTAMESHGSRRRWVSATQDCRKRH